MAKNDKADDVKPGGEGGGGGSNKLILILILVNLLAVAGVGVYLVLFSGNPEGQAAAQEPAPAPNEFGPLIEVPTIIVNLSGQRWGRFMRVSMHLEAKDVEAQPLIEAALVPIRNRMVIFFSELDPERTREVGAKEAIAEELGEAVNEMLGDDLVRRVFYAEFVIQ